MAAILHVDRARVRAEWTLRVREMQSYRRIAGRRYWVRGTEGC